jgi:hypothetical protein
MSCSHKELTVRDGVVFVRVFGRLIKLLHGVEGRYACAKGGRRARTGVLQSGVRRGSQCGVSHAAVCWQLVARVRESQADVASREMLCCGGMVVIVAVLPADAIEGRGVSL